MERRSFLRRAAAAVAALVAVGQMPKTATAQPMDARPDGYVVMYGDELAHSMTTTPESVADILEQARAEGYLRGYDVATARAESRSELIGPGVAHTHGAAGWPPSWTDPSQTHRHGIGPYGGMPVIDHTHTVVGYPYVYVREGRAESRGVTA